MVIIRNIRQLKGIGVLADRSPKAENLGFLRFNLLYGFNGSGKSTLSRLFSSLQNGKTNERLPDNCTFEFELDDGTNLSSSQSLVGLEKRICVFNTDFIEENLQWAAGRANPIFYIGTEQADLASKLEILEQTLPAARSKIENAEKTISEREKTFATYKRERAREVSSRLRQTGRKYEATQLTNDYQTLTFESNSVLTNEALDAVAATCARPDPPIALSVVELPIAQILCVVEAAANLSTKSVGQVVVDGLDTHAQMVSWVMTGHEYHQSHELDFCLHCGEKISKSRRDLLGQAFDDGLSTFIDSLTLANREAALASDVLTVAQYSIPADAQLLEECRAEFATAVTNLTEGLGYLKGILHSSLVVLGARQLNPLTPIETGVPSFEEARQKFEIIQARCEAINAIINIHNDVVTNFKQHQEDARLSIRRHYLADGYTTYTAHAQELASAGTAASNARVALEALQTEIASLRAKVQQHGPVAEKINKLVKSYLGHGELTIVTVEKGYELHRHGKLVRGAPSEGEKTAIALCYFLSTLESDGRKTKSLIVVIDDPISSLDTKAMNYACALIRSRLSDVAQLFLLTHNQHCMNEFKKDWKNKARAAKPSDKPTARLFYIDVTIPDGASERTAVIIEMPRLLREYESEYQYLFQKVLQFEAVGTGHCDYAFMMPNVIRRILEIFLAFRIPRSGNLSDKLNDLCKGDKALDPYRLAALERLSQVESHSDNLDDLIGHSSMTIEETRDATIALLALMEKVDPDHLTGLRKYCNPTP